MSWAKLSKLSKLVREPNYFSAMTKHRVAAAIEHVDAVEFVAAATLLDIGANKGQFSTVVRTCSPGAVIHAFEPLPAGADRYEALFAGDARTTLHRVALGENSRTAVFHVTDREDSSSLLKPGAGQKAAFGVSETRTIEVQVKPLDAVLNIAELPHPILAKIDVQGAELEVLRGMGQIEAIDAIYVELSFVELYEGQPLFADVRDYLEARGFELRGVFNQAFTPNFGPTQADCLFVQRKTRETAGE